MGSLARLIRRRSPVVAVDGTYPSADIGLETPASGLSSSLEGT
ncbi:hypothetical protein [Natrinema soli]|uniref:Uncharacterized protein n=1 Tax=Natrinema soli TaxID=1930624 RepID=A0ABD5SRP1_9EURY|nr:hypothetical protein [Natrinema soli]